MGCCVDIVLEYHNFYQTISELSRFAFIRSICEFSFLWAPTSIEYGQMTPERLSSDTLVLRSSIESAGPFKPSLLAISCYRIVVEA